MRNELGQASLLAFILSLLLAGTTFFVGYGDPAPTSNADSERTDAQQDGRYKRRVAAAAVASSAVASALVGLCLGVLGIRRKEGGIAYAGLLGNTLLVLAYAGVSMAAML